MKQCLKFKENKFFLKVLLTYCAIILIGVSISAYIITTTVLNKLVEAESKYENEILQKVKNYTEERFKDIDKIFSQIYLGTYYSSSIMEMIIMPPDKNLPLGSRNHEIQVEIQNICSANSFIKDLIILDYKNEGVYFTSNEKNRDISISFDFHNSDFVKKTMGTTNHRKIMPLYIPDYVVTNKNTEVISVCINLVDQNSASQNEIIGAVVINLSPQIFETPYKDTKEKLKGNIFITDRSGYIFFDSNNTQNGKKLKEEEYFKNGELELGRIGNAMINQLQSESIGLRFIDMVNKEEIYKDIYPVQKNVFQIIIVCIVVTLILSFFAVSAFTKRLKNLTKHMKLVEKGDLNSQIKVKTNDEIGYLEKSFNSMCQKLKEYISTVYISDIKTKTFHLRALQAQINPHFMFNTLESIRITALINGDKQSAKMIHILGNMFRWNIRTKDNFVDIDDELEYTLSYIELQKIRYSNSFEVNIDVAEQIRALGIPKLVMQPIVENAIYYGLSSMNKDGKLTIKGEIINGNVRIEIINNGSEVTPERISEVMKNLKGVSNDDDMYNIGMRNVHQRIYILFGKDYGIEMSNKEGLGVLVAINIPALSKQEMENYV